MGDTQYWGGGYAIEAYRLILTYAFDRLNLRRIVGGTWVDNARSIVLSDKSEYSREGCQREHFLQNNVAYDILLFGLLRRDFLFLFPN